MKLSTLLPLSLLIICYFHYFVFSKPPPTKIKMAFQWAARSWTRRHLWMNRLCWICPPSDCYSFLNPTFYPREFSGTSVTFELSYWWNWNDNLKRKKNLNIYSLLVCVCTCTLLYVGWTHICVLRENWTYRLFHKTSYLEKRCFSRNGQR